MGQSDGVKFSMQEVFKNKHLGQGHVKECTKSSHRNFNDRYGDLIKQCEVRLSILFHDILGHEHMKCHPPCSDVTLTYDLVTEMNFVTESDFLWELKTKSTNIFTI